MVLVMGWIRDLLSSNEDSIEDVQPEREERFPRHTYGPGYPIVIHRQELEDLANLLEMDSKAPDGWDNSPLLSREDFEEIVEDQIGDVGGGLPSPEERRSEIREIIELWSEQLTGSEDTVWTTIGTDYQLKFYITYCEGRASSDEDDFEETTELDTAREILDRIQTAHDTDSKLAIVHKRDLPLEEPEKDS
jgi:hypothetical protein